MRLLAGAQTQGFVHFGPQLPSEEVVAHVVAEGAGATSSLRSKRRADLNEGTGA